MTNPTEKAKGQDVEALSAWAEGRRLMRTEELALTVKTLLASHTALEEDVARASNEEREAAELLSMMRDQLTAAQDQLVRAVELVKPFARACELLDEGLSVAIALDDGTVMVPDEAFRRAAAYISDNREGGA